MSEIIIRMATIQDAEKILEIYEPFILNTVITFEYDKVSLLTFQDRMSKILERLPWLVCCIDNEIVGYAYGSPHLERAAYCWDCECSVYISEKYHRRGIASALYEALFDIIKKQGYYNVYSLICVPNESSEILHIKHDFSKIGIYYKTAYKFGKWRDLLVMEKRLQPIFEEPNPVISIKDLDKSIVAKAVQKAVNLVSDKKN